MHIVAQNDVVIYHQHVIHASGDETVQADIFKVRDGKIIEHWDVMQVVQEKTASGHPMW